MQLTYLKNANHEDLKRIYNYNIELIEKYEDLSSIDFEYVKKWIDKKIKTNIEAYTCIYLNGQKVGYIYLHEEKEGIEIDDFYIFEEKRNQGIGSQVLKDILKEGPYFLYVFLKNEKALRLYERFGFKIDETIHNTRVIMRCQTNEELIK